MPEKTAKVIQKMGAKNVAITGIQTNGNKISVSNNKFHSFPKKFPIDEKISLNGQ